MMYIKALKVLGFLTLCIMPYVLAAAFPPLIALIGFWVCVSINIFCMLKKINFFNVLSKSNSSVSMAAWLQQITLNTMLSIDSLEIVFMFVVPFPAMLALRILTGLVAVVMLGFGAQKLWEHFTGRTPEAQAAQQKQDEVTQAKDTICAKIAAVNPNCTLTTNEIKALEADATVMTPDFRASLAAYKSAVGTLIKSPSSSMSDMQKLGDNETLLFPVRIIYSRSASSDDGKGDIKMPLLSNHSGVLTGDYLCIGQLVTQPRNELKSAASNGTLSHRLEYGLPPAQQQFVMNARQLLSQKGIVTEMHAPVLTMKPATVEASFVTLPKSPFLSSDEINALKRSNMGPRLKEGLRIYEVVVGTVMDADMMAISGDEVPIEPIRIIYRKDANNTLSVHSYDSRVVCNMLQDKVIDPIHRRPIRDAEIRYGLPDEQRCFVVRAREFLSDQAANAAAKSKASVAAQIRLATDAKAASSTDDKTLPAASAPVSPQPFPSSNGLPADQHPPGMRHLDFFRTRISGREALYATARLKTSPAALNRLPTDAKAAAETPDDRTIPGASIPQPPQPPVMALSTN